MIVKLSKLQKFILMEARKHSIVENADILTKWVRV